MHYDARTSDHRLRYNPFKALVIPRPIGWISTLSTSGVVNLAPYSFFNAVSSSPPMVMFSSTDAKDSRYNAEQTGEFVTSLATWALREEMNASSASFARGVSEPDEVGVEMTPSVYVRPPRVARSPVALECRYVKTVDLATADGRPVAAALVLGEVVGVYIDDTLIENGRVNIAKAIPISRLGYYDYGVLDHTFVLDKPD